MAWSFNLRGGDYLMVLLQVEGAGPILGAADFDQL
jgi:hypothetical protein